MLHDLTPQSDTEKREVKQKGQICSLIVNTQKNTSIQKFFLVFFLLLHLLIKTVK